MTLFRHREQKLIREEAPLAARMRPRTLDEYVGQDHIVGPGRLLRRAIEADQLSSLVFYGPPGTGKTTLARIIANTTEAHFIAINAVLAGVKDIRASIQTARDRLGQQAQRTILFVDEVHRFNKAQQDALLPWVENGTVILVGATTENPYFEVNKALVSRSRVFQLTSLGEDDLVTILIQTVEDAERGLGARPIHLAPDAVAHLVNVANGDARAVLNALELAVETTPATLLGTDARAATRSQPTLPDDVTERVATRGQRSDHARRSGWWNLAALGTDDAPAPPAVIDIDLAVAEESIQRRAVLYDKEGDAHFDTISAFIKSLRGSDPDASLYWLARMIYAGEDPRYVFRRLIIFAGEDIGLAQPEAMSVILACAQAFDRVGMPEGRFHLSQATLYAATASKSNSTMAFFDALAVVGAERESEVPNHLKDGNRDSESFGHGKGYLYPHAYRDHWVAQQYLPTALQGRAFYEPSDQGYEGAIRNTIAQRREAQLAAMVEGLGPTHIETLTFSPDDPGVERWLQRTVGGTGARLARLRDAVFDRAALQRHATVLDLNASTGLLTWEALRRVPEGLVVAWTPSPVDAAGLEQLAERLPELRRPMVASGSIAELRRALDERHPGLCVDAIVGRNALVQERDKTATARRLRDLIADEGTLTIAEAVPRRTQRIVDLVDTPALRARLADADPLDGAADLDVDSELLARWRDAEAAIYEDDDDPMLDWDVDDLRAAIAAAGWTIVDVAVERDHAHVRILAPVIERWFDPMNTRSYAQRLQRAGLPPSDLATVGDLVERVLLGTTVAWGATTAIVRAKPSPPE